MIYIIILIYSISFLTAYRMGLKDGLSVSTGDKIEPVIKLKNKSKSSELSTDFEEDCKAIEEFVQRGGIVGNH